jgi:hypothetical protein
VLAAAIAQLGRIDEAHSAIKAGLALNPTFSMSRARAAWKAMSDDPTYWPSSSLFSKEWARPDCRKNKRGPPLRRRRPWLLAIAGPALLRARLDRRSIRLGDWWGVHEPSVTSTFGQ